MIEIYGTSHIAQESYEKVEETVEREKPDVIAIELDEVRLKSLIEGKKGGFTSPIIFLMRKLQERLGRKTGVMPGKEMLEAVKVADRKDITLALIDQPIERTVRGIKGLPLMEKMKLILALLGGFFLPFLGLGKKFDLRKVPEEDLVDKAIGELKSEFPQLYKVLVEERNQIMAENLELLDEEYEKVVAFVGAGHRKGIEELLD